ncbi:MAG: Y-family DNA polymerase [Candidatus Melainabacteria bacterium]
MSPRAHIPPGTPPPLALADCNNFFVSCERVFRPDLNHRPVVVLSNNDGCIVSRSNEAKQLGIKMGEPLFKIRDLVRHHNVQVFSGNFSLYGNLSDRVMTLLESFSPQVDIYSVDEAFLDFSHLPPDAHRAHGAAIRRALLQCVKIPVSIGVAETKTLAKVAAEYAKQTRHGVLSIYGRPDLRERALKKLPVGEVWGVGPRSAEKLRLRRIHTAWDLHDADDDWLLKHFNVVFMRTVYELRGLPCLPLGAAAPERKSLIFSRSFGERVTTFEEMRQTVVNYTARAAEKVRRHRLVVNVLGVAINTSRHHPGEPQYRNAAWRHLPVATDCTHELARQSVACLESIYRDGFRYYKTTITLLELVPLSTVQQGLFDTTDREKLHRLMTSMDWINHNLGAGLVHYAGEGMQQRWWMKLAHRSAGYTHRWDGLREVR